MKQQPVYKWFKIVGQAEAFQVTYFIEAQTTGNVLKYYGGRRKYVVPQGDSVSVEFPKNEKNVQRMPSGWLPTTEHLTGNQHEDSSSFVQVIPAKRFRCECGKVHLSDGPYRSMWCTCGKKASLIQAE